MTKLSRVGAKQKPDPHLPQYPSLVHMLHAAVLAHPQVTAVIYQERRITYAEFGRAVAGLARDLARRGIGSGDRVIVMMPNSIEMDIALMAVMAQRAQVAPVNPFFVPGELKKVLDGTDASLIICDPGAEQKARDVAQELDVPAVLALGAGAVEIGQWTADAALAIDTASLPQPDDLALLIFTGGSTGVPKGVNHTHRALLWGCLQHCTVWPVLPGGDTQLDLTRKYRIRFRIWWIVALLAPEVVAWL